jgi:hypothetical protein
MLHVLNGDATRVKLERSGVPGEITVWADVLHDGPVPDVPEEQLRRKRTEHLVAQFGATPQHVDREFHGQNDLYAFDRHDEVVFWFEHDLYDQLLLLRHLHWLSQIDPGPTRFALICIGEYLGELSPERLAELFRARRPITAEQIRAGREGWDRFRAPTPSLLVDWVETGGAGALEFMPAALHRLFEEYPAGRDGLSRTERQALEAVRDGARTIAEAFVASQDMEESFFMGDLSFWDVIRRLAEGREPLLSANLPPGDLPSGREPVSLTDAGRRVLAGEADHVGLNGIDRWIGGVHLTPHNCWRWEPSLKLLKREMTGQ